MLFVHGPLGLRMASPFEQSWQLLKRQTTLDQFTERGVMGNLPAPVFYHSTRAPLATLAREGLDPSTTEGMTEEKKEAWSRIKPDVNPRWRGAGVDRYSNTKYGDIDKLHYETMLAGKPENEMEKRRRKHAIAAYKKNAEKQSAKEAAGGATYVFPSEIPDAMYPDEVHYMGSTGLEAAKNWTQGGAGNVVGIRPIQGPGGPGDFTMMPYNVDYQGLMQGERQLTDPVPPERLVFM